MGVGPLRVVERIAGVQHSSAQAEDAWQGILSFDAQLR